jgi:endo-1,4-beta-xylanase
MDKNWNRREALRTLSLGVIAGRRLLDVRPRAAVATPLARCTVFNHRGEPLKAEEFARFHTCDFLMRPFTFEPRFEPGMAIFRPPERPFRIAMPLTVPGFGQVFVYADNRGRGYTAQSFADKPLALNYEFAADRLATVRAMHEECQRSGLTISAAVQQRLDKAGVLLRRAEGLVQDHAAYVNAVMSSLCESLWAGEMIVIERAERRIAKQGLREGFLLGCNAFGYPQHGQPYTERFESLFNFATLPFYETTVESTEGRPDYSFAERLLTWLDRTKIAVKGHPLIFLVEDATPSWLRYLPFEQTKEFCLRHVRRSIAKFRHRVHIWDVINEAHVQPDELSDPNKMKTFTKEQAVELTGAALLAAREADPTCFRVVNSTGTWCDYYMARNPFPWQQSVYDYLQALKDHEMDYEAIGLQYYHSGRDLLEFERNLDSFKQFGKRMHLTELGISSSADNADKDPWWGGGIGGAKLVWRGERFTEETQAQWVEAVYKIAFSKPYVDAITWWDFTDPGFPPNGGLLRANCTPKPAYERLQTLLQGWRQAGLLPKKPGS